MANTYTNLLVHIVHSTKNREPLIDAVLQPELYHYIGGIIRGERGILLEGGGVADHIHLLARFNADRSVAAMVNKIKSNSSKWINEMPNRDGRFEWQEGYGAFSVSESQVAAIRTYIQTQEEHHRKHSFQDEYREFLRRHGFEIDERYVWG